jgi:hypothetical protein
VLLLSVGVLMVALVCCCCALRRGKVQTYCRKPMGYGYMIDVTAPTTETDAKHENCDASGSENPEQIHDYCT